MRKIILVMLLAFVSNSAIAEWVEVGNIATSAIYADSSTISKDGNRVKMWTLDDFKTAKVWSGKPFMSIKSQVEYDCKEKQTRLLFSSFFSGNISSGEPIVSSSNRHPEWSPALPGSINELMLEFACKKQYRNKK